MAESTLEPRYSNSHALVIGINNYLHVSPLGFAKSDAVAIVKLLSAQLTFPEENVVVLLDQEATRKAVATTFLHFAAKTTANDRLVVFFAEHGHTLPSRRGDVGFLVPHDGYIDDLATLVRWDDLTRGADLFEAKHVLFLMDACYGGLAVTRNVRPGSMRFLKDMLLRSARQVLTAGKANEVVADHGGPVPGHSVFTGHLLQALGGNAADRDGIITASSVMAYVYERVSRDPASRQTPHFGHIDGDGDLIFVAPVLSELQADEQRDKDKLVSIPVVMNEQPDDVVMTLTEQVKGFLSDDRHVIRLHDVAAAEIRTTLALTSEDHFPVHGNWAAEEFRKRLQQYEDVTATLRDIEALVGYWGRSPHHETLTLPIRRISGRLALPQGGVTAWLGLRWYPVLLLLYSAGVAAVAGTKYDNLKALFRLRVDNGDEGEVTSVLRAAYSGVGRNGEAFKMLPGHERNYVPLSENLFKLLQPRFDDLLFLGTEYESHFDAFEIMATLDFADELSRAKPGRVWGPIGRFGWKHTRGTGGGPFQRVLSEAESQGDAWAPIRAGLFGGSISRFTDIAKLYKTEILDRLGWW